MTILIFGAVALLIGYAVERIAQYLNPADDRLVGEVNALLPQTQCAQCGYAGCKPYAQAIVKNDAPIDRCPPGGPTTVHALSRLLGREPSSKPLPQTQPRVARIKEDECIGCTLCIQACPVDAIVGAHECMHSVIEQYCTGCELCVAPCPVDCIEMVEAKTHQTDAATIQVETACIHCARCSDVCPLELPAHELYQSIGAHDLEAANDQGLSDCILCGACDSVCPSHIPLAALYRDAKRQRRQSAEQRTLAAAAQARYEARNARRRQKELKTQHSWQTQKERLKEQIKKKSAPC